MKISALVDITEGELKNTPSISFITQIHTTISKINNGDAFIALSHRDIPKALDLGAFAILHEKPVKIIDNEIAWIQVPSIQKAMTNILRYHLSKKENAQFFYIDKILYHFLDIFKTKDINIILLKDSLKSNFELLISNNFDKYNIIFSYDNFLLQKIFPSFKIIQVAKYSIYNLISTTLFDTTFSYKGVLFENIKLPKLYINYFLTIYNFFNQKIDLKKLNNLELLKPIFINRSLHIVPFGQTNRFILANKNIEISKLELRYLNKEYKYGTIKVIDKPHLTPKQIKIYLKKHTNINIIYFKHTSISYIEKILLEDSYNPSLF